jgi:hypothetical protein
MTVRGLKTQHREMSVRRTQIARSPPFTLTSGGVFDSLSPYRQRAPQTLSASVDVLRPPPSAVPDQRHAVISGSSSPCSSMYCLCSISLSRIACLKYAAGSRAAAGGRSHPAPVETVEFVQHHHVEGVVVVPSSL